MEVVHVRVVVAGMVAVASASAQQATVVQTRPPAPPAAVLSGVRSSSQPANITAFVSTRSHVDCPTQVALLFLPDGAILVTERAGRLRGDRDGVLDTVGLRPTR